MGTHKKNSSKQTPTKIIIIDHTPTGGTLKNKRSSDTYSRKTKRQFTPTSNQKLFIFSFLDKHINEFEQF